MKKYSVIKNLAVIVTMMIIAGNYSCSCPSNEKKVGIQLWSVREDMKTNPKATIEAIGKMGYKYIETAGYRDGKFYGMEPAEFKALVDSNGMEFISSHAGKSMPDSANMGQAMLWWDTCIAAHKAAGAKYIIQASLMHEHALDSMPILLDYCKYFNAVGEKCNAAGLRFGFHNHSHEFDSIDGQIAYDVMLQNTDPAKVMFQLDLYWIYKGNQNAVDYFNKYPGRFELYHVKDSAELGTGVMDFKPAFENAEKAGMKYYVVEVEKYNFTPLESIQKSLEFLKAQDFTK